MKQELIDVVRALKDSYAKGNDYLNSIPNDIRSVVFDNRYTERLEHDVDTLINALFGDAYEDVAWFLYEYHAERASAGPHLILADGTEYTFKTNEDYYQYLKDAVE